MIPGKKGTFQRRWRFKAVFDLREPIKVLSRAVRGQISECGKQPFRYVSHLNLFVNVSKHALLLWIIINKQTHLPFSDVNFCTIKGFTKNFHRQFQGFIKINSFFVIFLLQLWDSSLNKEKWKFRDVFYCDSGVLKHVLFPLELSLFY